MIKICLKIILNILGISPDSFFTNGCKLQHTSSLKSIIQPQLEAIKEAGTWKAERIIASPQRTQISLLNGKKVLNFCANNYLGLSVSWKQ